MLSSFYFDRVAGHPESHWDEGSELMDARTKQGWGHGAGLPISALGRQKWVGL